jgi:hypothetical protein
MPTYIVCKLLKVSDFDLMQRVGWVENVPLDVKGKVISSLTYCYC